MFKSRFVILHKFHFSRQFYIVRPLLVGLGILHVWKDYGEALMLCGRVEMHSHNILTWDNFNEQVFEVSYSKDFLYSGYDHVFILVVLVICCLHFFLLI